MKPRLLELGFGLGICTVGLVFGILEEEICQNKCWLDAASDYILPTAWDAYSGGLPWAAVGLVFIAAAFRDRK